MRVDTTVVETNIHYPTDSTRLGDGARLLTRTMKKLEKRAGKLQRRVRDRTRSVNRRVFGIALAARHQGNEGEERRKKQYRELLRLSRQILNDTRRVIDEVEDLSRNKKKSLQSLTTDLAEMAGRVRQVIRQTKGRVFHGLTQWKRTSKSSGACARLVAADAGFYSRVQERAAQEKGVRWVAVPNRSTKERRPEEAGTESLVQESAGVEDWVRGTDQRHQTSPWPEPLPLPRCGGHEAMGRPRRDRRQPDQHRKRSGGRPCVKSGGEVAPLSRERGRKTPPEHGTVGATKAPDRPESVILRWKVAK
jgi:hypothetical protein